MKNSQRLLTTTISAIGIFIICFDVVYLFGKGFSPSINVVSIHKNQEINADGLNFKVKDVAVHKSTNNVVAKVLIHINHQPAKGLRSLNSNYNYGSNMFLKVPFKRSSPAESITDLAGNRLGYPDLQKKEMDVVVHFSTDRNTFELGGIQPRFSFMVPSRKVINNYSMLIS